MSDVTYRTNLDMIASSIALLRLLPIVEMRQLVDEMQTLGPILEPTAYLRGGGDNLRDQAEVLTAVAALLAVVDRVEARAGARR
jgi:hypothetical protein